MKDEDHGVRDNEDDKEENGEEEDAGTGRSIWQTENRVEHYHQRRTERGHASNATKINRMKNKAPDSHLHAQVLIQRNCP